VRSVIAEVQFTEGPNHLYHLVLAQGPGSVPPRDATGDETALRLLWHGLRRTSRRTDQTALQVTFAEGLPAAPRPELIPGEQSNSSIRYGSAAVLKLFRRLVVGTNPDLEIHQRLTGDVAGLLGSATATWLPAAAGPHDPVRTADLAMMVELVPGAHDGWSLALAAARRGDSFARSARELGAVLRRTHQALAAAFGASTAPGGEVAAILGADLERRVATVAPLAPYAADLRRLYRALSGQDLAVQRIHGDHHLGQVLQGSDGRWTVIDFEGEPMKARSERVRADSPWRDVAGMLRSFSYAGAVSAQEGTPDQGQVAAWVQQSRDAFLAGYLDGSAPTPQDRALLVAYEADRASYEVAYDAGHRPEWLEISLHDVARLAEGPGTEEQP